jgi:hypothetical protein
MIAAGWLSIGACGGHGSSSVRDASAGGGSGGATTSAGGAGGAASGGTSGSGGTSAGGASGSGGSSSGGAPGAGGASGAGGSSAGGTDGGAGGASDAGDASDGGSTPTCTGVGCQVVNCAAQNKPPTSVSGIVYAPNGTLPLYGVNVYVPTNGMDPGTLPTGATCDPCSGGLLGGVAIDPTGKPVSTTTDATGMFTLDNLPATDNLTLIVQTGKWRKEITLATVSACAPVQLTAAQTTLPKNRTQGDMPQIAVTTGGADAVECLIRKLGIADSEFTTDQGAGRVHLYAGTGGSARFMGGSTLSAATALWSSTTKMKTYDMLLLACEGAQNPATKSVTSMQALFDYTTMGGRVYLAHFHNIWLEQGPPPWPAVATFSTNATNLTSATVTVDPGFDQAASFTAWLTATTATTMPGKITVQGARETCVSVGPQGQGWLDLAAASNPGGFDGVQMFDFTTPLSMPAANRCGRVLFTDMHAAPEATPGSDFPSGCTGSTLTAQDKALTFAIFQLGACIGS